MARGISSMKAAPDAAEYVRCGALLETEHEYSPAKLSVFGLRKRFKGKPRAESRGGFQCQQRCPRGPPASQGLCLAHVGPTLSARRCSSKPALSLSSSINSEPRPSCRPPIGTCRLVRRCLE